MKRFLLNTIFLFTGSGAPAKAGPSVLQLFGDIPFGKPPAHLAC
jgi:hypothetical protein